MLKRHSVEIESSKVTATVRLGTDAKDQGVKLEVDLTVHVEGLDLDNAKKYVEMAHSYCPYSKAISGNVDVKIDVV